MSRLYLTDVCNAIGDRLNSSSPRDWGGGLTVPQDMPVVLGFDPVTEGGDTTKKGIYITPSNNEYSLENSRRNSDARPGAKRTLFVVVSVVQPFETIGDVTDSPDVSKVSEWTLLSKLQEDLEEFLIQTSIPGVKLISIEPEQPLETALDQRLYLAPIVLGYTGC